MSNKKENILAMLVIKSTIGRKVRVITKEGVEISNVAFEGIFNNKAGFPIETQSRPGAEKVYITLPIDTIAGVEVVSDPYTNEEDLDKTVELLSSYVGKYIYFITKVNTLVSGKLEKVDKDMITLLERFSERDEHCYVGTRLFKAFKV